MGINKQETWSILTAFDQTKIYSKYAGELRFGPAFIHIKTEPVNVFGEEFYGDWFFRTAKGVYLQRWNSNPLDQGIRTKAINDLVFYNPQKHKVSLILNGIKSFLWTIEKSENTILILASDNGKTIDRIKIPNPAL